MYPWIQADFMIDLSDICFEHVITESGYVTRDELSAILATEINEIEYHKFKKMCRTCSHHFKSPPPS